MIHWGINLIKKHREAFLYLFFGGLTVFINIALFVVFDTIGLDLLYANTFAFILAVLFAYYTNAKYVFKNAFTATNFLQFFGMRIGTIFIDNGGMLLFTNFGMHKLLSKMIVNVIIIVLNYVFSKFFIFKKEREH